MAESPETGRILRDARIAAGRSLEEMAQETRINARYLGEIEEGAGFSLPEIYRRTFVRTYARALGVDPETLPLDTPAAAGTGAVPEGPAASGGAPVIAPGPPVDEVVTSSRLGSNPFAEKSQLRTMIVVVALLLTALVFSVKWFGSGPGETGEGPQAAGPDTAAAVRPDRLPAFSSGGGAPAVVGRAYGGDSLVLQASTTESVWVHIVIDNDSTIEYTLPPRYAVTLRAKDNFLLAVGNPAGLTLMLNGRKLNVLGAGNRPVKNVFLSRKSLTE